MAHRRLPVRLGLVLAAFLMLTTFYNVAMPEYEPIEEGLHFDYVRYVAEHRSLPPPLPAREVVRPGGESERHQPPLYYALVALAISWIDTHDLPGWHRNPEATWAETPTASYLALHREDEGFPYAGVSLAIHLARLVSSLMGMIVVLSTYRIASLVLQRKDLALYAAAIVAFTPGFVATSATVNNDSGVNMFSSLALLVSALLLAKPASIPLFFAYALTISAAVMSKANGLQLLPVATFTAVSLLLMKTGLAKTSRPRLPFRHLEQGRLRWNVPSIRGFVFALSGAVTAVLTPFALVRIVGGESAWIHRIIGALSNAQAWLSTAWLVDIVRAGKWDVLAGFVSSLFMSYWGVFGWENIRMDWIAYFVVALMSFLAIGGLVRVAMSPSGLMAIPWSARAGLVALLLSIATTLWIVVSRGATSGYVLGFDHGRFLYPTIAAFGVLLAAGLSKVHFPRVRWSLVQFIVPFLFILSALSPFAYIRPFFAAIPAIPVRSSLDAKEAIISARTEFENGVSLVGYAVDKQRARPGEDLVVRLYWYADRDIQEDFTAFVHLTAVDGSRRGGVDAIPLSDLFPPSRWEQGEYVRDVRTVPIPADAPLGSYAIYVGLYSKLASTGGSGLIAVMSGDTDETRLRLRIGQLRLVADDDTSAGVTKLDLTFNEELRLVGYDVRSAAQGEPLEVALYWQANSPVKKDYTVSLQVLDESGRLVAQHDGMPGGGLNRTSSWEPGETIPDVHPLQITSHNNHELRLYVVVYAAESLQRLIVQDADRHVLGDSAVIGELQ